MGRGGIVLAGGFSRRMGRDKASLPFGGETMAARTARLIAGACDEVVLVLREGQEFETDLRVARDPGEGLGPLAGLVAGLEALDCDAAFLTGCDSPFLVPGLVEALFDAAEGREAAVPLVGEYHMVTCAVYGRAALAAGREMLAADERRLLHLVQRLDANIVGEEAVRRVDPGLASFRNCNTPEAYEEALHDAGLATVDRGAP